MPNSRAWLSQTLQQKQTRWVGGALALLIAIAVLLRLNLGSPNNDQTSSPGAGILPASLTGRPVLQSIENATLGFNAILAINLPERTDRRVGLVLASAVSGMQVEIVPGVHSNDVLDKYLPSQHSNGVTAAQKASWRAHVNALSRVVESRRGSALILEDDVDWDVRLRKQLHDFAVSCNSVLRAESRSGPITMQQAAGVQSPTQSPYGDGWDVLWLGHCGMKLPEPDTPAVYHKDDETVAAIRHQKSWDVNEESPLKTLPEHTRVVTQVVEGTCSLAYAVTQEGARKLLFTLGLRRLDRAFDLMLREWCQGSYELGHDSRCVSVLPQLFDHHRRVGAEGIDSDISAPNNNYRDEAYTLNIRQSVRMNMEKLLTGSTNFSDQWPD